MDDILNFLATNYVLIIICAIVILLAVIGYFADETNFGQPKESKSNYDDKKDENKNDLYPKPDENSNLLNYQNNLNDHNSNLTNNQIISQKNDKSDKNVELNNDLINDINNNLKANTELINNMNNNLNANNKLINNINNNLNDKLINNSDYSKEDISNTNNYENLDKQLDELLPRKGIVETDILDSIDDMSLEKTQKFNFDSLGDLGNIELPSIKNLKKYDEDIWKL
ncbi:MAG: hypothetical protein Q4E75_03595 [bacterium]|nr:hypothetical protein [bacterium]